MFTFCSRHRHLRLPLRLRRARPPAENTILKREAVEEEADPEEALKEMLKDEPEADDEYAAPGVRRPPRPSPAAAAVRRFER